MQDHQEDLVEDRQLALQEHLALQDKVMLGEEVLTLLQLMLQVVGVGLALQELLEHLLRVVMVEQVLHLL
jgi:hypothetical protein